MLGVRIQSDSFNPLPEPSPVRAGTEGRRLVPAIGDMLGGIGPFCGSFAWEVGLLAPGK